MRVALIGTGLQARRRAPVFAGLPRDSLVVVGSSDAERAREFARLYGCESTGDWRAAVTRKDIDAVVVCTTTDRHAEIAIAALGAGKHVLVEKPLGRTLQEAQAMYEAARAADRILKCGFNHRHHPGILAAKAIVERGDLGNLIIGRCRYGLCGRSGYEKEWRGDPDKTAGGNLLELGIHAIDLFRWFFGEVQEVSCMTATQYFPMAPLDDNGMAMFRHRSGALCSLHSSLTQWKNLFSFEVFGSEGYLAVEGLGGSYGTERLTVGRRDFTAPFQDVVTEWRGEDRSWQLEWGEFASAIDARREPLGNAHDGVEALRIAFGAYEADREGRVISLQPAGKSPP